jgi:hypothetical protein
MNGSIKTFWSLSLDSQRRWVNYCKNIKILNFPSKKTAQTYPLAAYAPFCQD